VPTPSYLPGKPSDELSRFTNRKPEIEWFKRYLNAPAGSLSRLPALMFYGVGGIGKSWLLKYLKRQLGDTWRGVATVRIDFTREGASNRIRDDFVEALAAIRGDITPEPCPRFDLAYGFLQVHRGVRDESTLDKPVRKTAFGVANEFIKGGLGLIPVVGAPLQIGYSVLEKLYPHLKGKLGLDDLAKTIQQELKTLRDLEVADIEKTLVWRLTEDLKSEGVITPPSSFHAAQAVIFVDTLEALGPADTSDASIEISTRWLRDLICQLDSRVLFVLAGQNRLAWERIDPDWADSSWLEQRVVGGLHGADAGAFLSRCGIHDAAVQETMLAVCLTSDGGYHSFHLGLLADLAWVEREVNHRPITPALFASLPPGDWTALALRFLKSLEDQADADWIRKLALTPEFDEAAARAAHSDHGSQAQDTDWRMLRSFSFLVGVGQKPGWWSIHSAMQGAIEQDLAREPERYREMHNWWRTYWQGRSANPRSVEAPLAWYHQWTLDKDEALGEWNRLAEESRSVVPLDMSFHYRLLSWWQPVRLLERRNWTEMDARAANNLGVEYWRSSIGSRTENLREAIACYQRALEVYTREAIPQDWATTQNNLGAAWGDLPGGDREQNLREAIACYQRALEVLTRDAFPQDWAMTQNNLGAAWGCLPGGDREQNLREAIACYQRALEVYTREAFPQAWAMAQNNLGIAWGDLPGGDREQNLREAIACYQRALEVRTREAFPQDWAATQNNLGVAWGDLPGGDREQNLREAIACYQRALEVRTREAFPQDWAMTQNNLGNGWQSLPGGDRELNLREAIACYQRALEVRTREAFPRDWAQTQNNLGIAWGDLPGGDREQNLREAIACYQRALEVFTREAFPQDWAMTQNNLGIAWGALPVGDREQNLREAIACYERALEVYTREAFPQDWAMTQNNLGISWGDLPGGDREQNLREAIACYQRALEVRTRDAFPQDWAMTQNNLNIARNSLEQWIQDSALPS
jgi:tetratricopeptide (TPR) repeat protein